MKAGSEFAQVQGGSGWSYRAGRACFAINELCDLGHVISPLGTSVFSSGSNNRSKIISVLCVCVYINNKHKASKCFWEAWHIVINIILIFSYF